MTPCIFCTCVYVCVFAIKIKGNKKAKRRLMPEYSSHFPLLKTGRKREGGERKREIERCRRGAGMMKDQEQRE